MAAALFDAVSMRLLCSLTEHTLVSVTLVDGLRSQRDISCTPVLSQINLVVSRDHVSSSLLARDVDLDLSHL
eukprot:3324635-Pleurochrysis_carterae.AAC.2